MTGIIEEHRDIINDIIEIYKNTHSDKIRTIIAKHFIPSIEEQKEYAEIPTPPLLIDEMLNTIPIIFWETPHSVLEPCCGKGNFILAIFDKFYIGLKKIYPDSYERCKVIATQCLYFSDINALDIFITSSILKCHIQNYCKNCELDYEFNSNIGDTLKLDIKKKWNINDFDAIIGNPPYENQKGSGDNKLYLDFTKYSINNLYKNGILLFITPTTIIDYIIQMDKNRNCLDEFYNIEYISLNTPEKYFTVSSTFTYFMLKKEKYVGNTIIQHYKGKESITLKKGMKLPKIPTKADLNIINKIYSSNNNFDIKVCNFSNKTQRIRKSHIANNIVSINETETHKYKIYDTINKTNPNGKYYYYDKLDNDAGKTRIILSNKGYLLPFVCENKNITYSDNFSYILYEPYLLKLLKSPIVNYLIKQFSKNGFDRINCIKMIKKVELKDNIYESFNLTEEEIKIILN